MNKFLRIQVHAKYFMFGCLFTRKTSLKKEPLEVKLSCLLFYSVCYFVCVFTTSCVCYFEKFIPGSEHFGSTKSCHV